VHSGADRAALDEAIVDVEVVVLPDEHSSFWATMPGILTGIAALITALVGAAALIIGLRDDTGTPSDPSTGGSNGGDGENASTVAMRVGDGLDVDTGKVGDVSDSEVFWSSTGGWDLNGNRAALLEGEADHVRCIEALEQRTDDFLPVRRFDDDVVCLETTEGAIAAVLPSTPDTSDRMSVNVIVWG
jgi:hypothetical protein